MQLTFDVKKTARDLAAIWRAPRVVRRYKLRHVRLRGPRPEVVLTNASIAHDSTGLVVATRQVSYRLVGRGARFRLLPGMAKRQSASWIAPLPELDSWTPQKVVFAEAPGVSAEEYEMGPEDPRLFMWKEALWGLWVLATRQPDGRRATRMAIGRIAGATVTDLTPLGSFRGRREEKNWIPFTVGDELRFIQELSTMSVYSWDGATLSIVAERQDEVPELIGHSGSSQLVRWRAGWVCITHTRINVPGHLIPLQRRYYIHRAVYLSDEYEVLSVSEPFVFERKRVEFCAGLALVNDEFYVGYGLQDRDASVAVMPESVMAELLRLQKQ